jgi:hypothetical protein
VQEAIKVQIDIYECKETSKGPDENSDEYTDEDPEEEEKKTN